MSKIGHHEFVRYKQSISKFETFEEFRRSNFRPTLFENAGNFERFKNENAGIKTILKFLGKPWKKWMIEDALRAIRTIDEGNPQHDLNYLKL